VTNDTTDAQTPPPSLRCTRSTQIVTSTQGLTVNIKMDNSDTNVCLHSNNKRYCDGVNILPCNILKHRLVIRSLENFQGLNRESSPGPAALWRTALPLAPYMRCLAVHFLLCQHVLHFCYNICYICYRLFRYESVVTNYVTNACQNASSCQCAVCVRFNHNMYIYGYSLETVSGIIFYGKV
jgi:hypothetical protein